MHSRGSRLWLAAAALALALAATARAGITIHYEGTAAAPEAVGKIVAAVKTFAAEQKWQVADASAADGKLSRVINNRPTDYQGRITGVVVTINDDCEPLYFQFDRDGFMQDSVKTQFAGGDIHVKIVALLEALKPLFRELNVDDEGEYWDSHDRQALDDHLADVELRISRVLKEHPEMRSPFREHTGRIADVAK